MTRWRREGSILENSVVDLPDWLAPLVAATRGMKTRDLTPVAPQDGIGRGAAVLILLGEGPDVLVIQRAPGSVAHAGQVAFPGGAREAFDHDAAATAVREAQEETGLDPQGVHVFGALPDLWVPVSDFVVSPVLGWWRHPSIVSVQDPKEVARVERIPLSELSDPQNRRTVISPSGYRGPGFVVRDMLIWGFTGGVLAGILDVTGWADPWDEHETVEVES